jgi:hypothetical protein
MTSSFVSLPRAAALSVAITVLASSIAAAQTPVGSVPTGGVTQSTPVGVPDVLARMEGKNVWITAEGVRRRGVVTSLSTTDMVLMEDGVATTIPFGQIVRIEKATHRLRKGTLIGLVSGVGAGAVLLAVLGCADDGFVGCSPADYVSGSLFSGGIGAGAGLGSGALANWAKRNSDVLYDARRRTTTIALVPILSPTRQGMAFSMAWR